MLALNDKAIITQSHSFLDTILLKPLPCTSKIFDLQHLAVISVSGEDSAKFLQGQLSCDINSLTNSKASVAAFCTPKGRVISTLLVVKAQATYLLILPASLQDKVSKKLQMYVLRSKVNLNSLDQTWQLRGLQRLFQESSGPVGAVSAENGVLKLAWSYGRELQLSLPSDQSPPAEHQPADDAEWIYQDIAAGFPWFDAGQSELYTPQMLNIDGLDGISFNKGCYTGQEIIARTHYLGAAKRHLFIAECQGIAPLLEDGSLSVLDAVNQQSLGSVLIAQSFLQHTLLLLVLQVADIGTHNLVLDDGKRTAIKLTHN
jgi:folate-binding protein YgfZ